MRRWKGGSRERIVVGNVGGCNLLVFVLTGEFFYVNDVTKLSNERCALLY